MNVQSVNSCSNTTDYKTKYNSEKSSSTVKVFSAPRSEMSENIYDKGFLFFYGPRFDDVKKYSKRASYAQDSTAENPIIKLEYIPQDKNKNYIVKYVDIKKIDPKNATLDEYRCLAAYLNTGGNTSFPCEPTTTGIDYNDNDRYDFASLVERDLKMYQANGIHHHVARYQKILNGIKSLMSTDYYKNNVETGKRGIGVKEALTISRKKHGIFYGSIKINKAIDMVDKYLEENKNRQIKEKKEQIKRIRAKRKQDEEDFEELLEKLRINRQLTKEKIFETQAERKDI